ncbi:MAG: FtsQ-type POTRA domain-containing protein [Gemmatimonadaceae bacterium]
MSDEPQARHRFTFLPRRFKLALFGIVALLVLAAPLWAPLLLRRMAFFHVRRVEILGSRYLAPSDILDRLHVDTTVSVWDPTAPLVARVQGDPEIERVTIHRKLPGTLVVEITERTPVALVPANGGFRVYDARGIPLPIDPARVTIDAPILMQRDTALFRLLGAMRDRMPAMYARVATIQRMADGELLFQFPLQPVRTLPDVTLERLAEVEPVEADLLRKQLRVAEIDLRYRDQVIARLQ